MSPSVPLPDVSLNDQRGQLFQTRDLKGKWNLMFFGYTNCPDICPTTLSTLKQVAKQLPDQPIRYIFVTVDPKRDTTEKLEKYLDFFSPDFIGLTGQKTEIDRLSQKVGAIYDYEGDTSGDDYIVNHYAAVLVVDPQARLRAHILPPHTTGKITNGIIKLMDYYGD